MCVAYWLLLCLSHLNSTAPPLCVTVAFSSFYACVGFCHPAYTLSAPALPLVKQNKDKFAGGANLAGRTSRRPEVPEETNRWPEDEPPPEDGRDGIESPPLEMAQNLPVPAAKAGCKGKLQID